MSKKNKLLVIGICALTLLLVGTSFAVWLVHQKQSTFNTITSGCIDITFTNGSGSLDLQNTAPITDSQGLALTGYTFTLKNNCNSEVSYLLNLDLFNVNNQTNLTTSEMKLAIDNKVPRKIALYDDATKNDNNAYGAKTLTSGRLAAKASETHTIKMWVDENTTTQNAVFSNRLFIMASPNLTVPEVASDDCFVMDGNGKILMYKTAMCPNNVVVPNVIQGQTVTGVGEQSFEDANALTIYDADNENVDFVILDEENYDTLSNIITSIVEQDIEMNGGVEWGIVPNYHIYKASEYNNWELFDGEHLVTVRDESIDGSSYGVTNTHRLNIPLDLDPDEYFSIYEGFVANTFDVIMDCSSCYFGAGAGATDNQPAHYLESIDFSNCSSLTSFDTWAVVYNANLIKVEFPNNAITFSGGSFADNDLNSVFIPTSTVSIGGSAFSSNSINYVELYSTNQMTIDNISFAYNNISQLVVNSTINVTGGNKPFSGNPLTSAGITIGHNSTNTAADFIE